MLGAALVGLAVLRTIAHRLHEGVVDAAVHLALARKGVVGDGELDGLQPLELVAQARGLLELEVGGGVASCAFRGRRWSP